MFDLAFDRVDIFLGNITAAALGVLIYIDIYLASGDGVQFIAELAFHTGTDRHDRDNRGDTDNDSQHGQKGTSLIGPDIIYGHLEIF